MQIDTSQGRRSSHNKIARPRSCATRNPMMKEAFHQTAGTYSNCHTPHWCKSKSNRLSASFSTTSPLFTSLLNTSLSFKPYDSQRAKRSTTRNYPQDILLPILSPYHSISVRAQPTTQQPTFIIVPSFLHTDKEANYPPNTGEQRTHEHSHSSRIYLPQDDGIAERLVVLHFHLHWLMLDSLLLLLVGLV